MARTKRAETLQFSDISIVSLNIETREEASSGQADAVSRTGNVEIENENGKEWTLVNKEGVEVNGRFRIDLTVRAFVKVRNEREAQHIRDDVEYFAYPLRAKATMIIALLSDQIMGVPILIPPVSPHERDDGDN